MSLSPVPGLPEIEPGADLAELLGRALARAEPRLCAQDVIVLAQKIVSKAESRYVELDDVTPSSRANELAAITGKDARLVEVVLGESVEVVRAVKDILIVRHRLGFVMAQGGVDQSNIPPGTRGDRALLLPVDPQRSAERLRRELTERFGISSGIIISDSFGRPWRVGVVNVAIGVAGVAALWDRRGDDDRHGRPLKITQVASADAVAAAAGLVMGEGGEGIPAVVVRGLRNEAPARGIEALIRPAGQDLFR